MKTILVINNQPCLDISTADVSESSPNYEVKYGLNRDRLPDNGWSQLRNTVLSNFKEVELTSELRKTLIEDLAYTYGHTTSKFSEKMKEFKLY